jgi:hypothetical protein
MAGFGGEPFPTGWVSVEFVYQVGFGQVYQVKMGSVCENGAGRFR